MNGLAIGVATGAIVVMGARSLRMQKVALEKPVSQKERVEKTGMFVKVGLLLSRFAFVERYASTAARQKMVGIVAIAGPLLLAVSVRLALVFVVACICHPLYVERRQRKMRRRAMSRELPMATDLLRLCVGGGLNITKSIDCVVPYLRGPLAEELGNVQLDVARGMRLADALASVGERVDDDIRALIGALMSSERHGAPLVSVLERLSFEARQDQERQAEQAARRLSVQLLFPVAGTILPAFALLTVAPLLAGAFGPLASTFH